MAAGILGLLYLATHGRRVTATWHRLNDLIAGDCNDRIVLPNRPEMALLAFLDVDAAVRTYCGGNYEKVSALGGRGRVSVCQAALRR